MSVENEENVEAWVTKYALTSGINHVYGTVHHGISSRMLSYENYGTAHGDDWHRTKEAALAQAHRMRESRIKSLELSLEKMRKLEFKITKDEIDET